MLDEKRIAELEEKIQKSKEVFREASGRFQVEDMRLIWSGGKDSTLTTWICRQFCQENGLSMPGALTIGEGDAFEEIDAFPKNYSKE
jgi:phosphoadenosine phosphosulfate reductase